MTDQGSLGKPGVSATTGRPRVTWDDRLVTAKLARPEVPPGCVERPRLHAALDRGTAGPVTVVTAGAGWGKTLLVSSWAARRSGQRHVAWLTLDADDDEPRVFWTYVLEALPGSGAINQDNPLASLDPVGGLSAATHRRIQLGLSELAHEVVLVLDDVSEVRSADVHDQVARLVRHPSPLRVVLVSRVEPPAPLHRLRVGGGMAEVRADQLAFTAHEATELLLGHGLGLDETQLADLLARTDGWAAGLRLAAMFLQRPGTELAEFGGADRAVADYLLSEVVAHQSQDTWQFLLRTSLVARICGELADHLTEQDAGHGQKTLDQLERENTFVTALGPDRAWYRYHPLLVETLREQMRIEHPNGVSEVHERAASWFSTHGHPVDAVRHAVAARSWSLVGTLMVDVALHRLQSTDRSALGAALAQIPVAELGRTAELQLCAAGLRMVQGRFAEIGPHLVAARAMLDADGERAAPSTRAALSLFECVSARSRGSATATAAAATSVLDTLDRHGSAIPLHQEWRAIALNNRGVGLLWLGDVEAATASLTAGLRACAAVGVELTMVNNLGYLGLAAAAAGQLRLATEWAGRCRSLAEERGWAALPEAATGYLTLALVALARSATDEAGQLVALGLQTQRNEPEPQALTALLLVEVMLDVEHGRYDAARVRLDRLRASVDLGHGSSLVHRWLARAEAEVQLATGGAAELAHRLEAVGQAGRSDADTLLLARARLVTGDILGLSQLLAPVVRQRNDLYLAVQASVVRALCAQRLRLDTEALEALERALADAAPEGLTAPFTGSGTAQLRGLLERLVLLRPAQSELARALLDLPETGAARRPQDASAERVTERERLVLRYLASMLSNAEIAEQLFVSPNTVKVHLRHVYNKLDVTSRRDAVRRAHELGLLDDHD